MLCSTQPNNGFDLLKNSHFASFLTFDFAETVSSPADCTLADFNDWDRSRDQFSNENCILLSANGI
mgnify:CR=1 FL=1